jgi:hypothetical protein
MKKCTAGRNEEEQKQSRITDVEEDLRRIRIQDWRLETQDRQDWSRIVWEAKVHTGL